jgi:hypothetical protein
MLFTFLSKYWRMKMKPEKYESLKEEVEFYIADWYFKGCRVLFFDDIKQAFPEIKEKQLKKMWRELK